MSLNIELDTLEGVDESIQSLYREDNGKFVLDVDLGDRYVPAEKVAGLKENHDKLLSEKKAAKAEAQRIAEEKARQSGDLESLQKSWAQKEESLASELTQLKQSIANKELDSVASSIAHDLADGAQAKILQRLAKDNLRFEDGEIKVVDDNGNLTMMTLDDLKKDLQSREGLKGLLRGSLATGSGATGGKNGGADQLTISRDQFDTMDQVERQKFFKIGGKVVN